MEDENMFLSRTAKNKGHSEEQLNFSIKNKEVNKMDMDKSAKEFADFMISVSDDMPELSEADINKGVDEILTKAFPAEEPAEQSKNKKLKKVTFRALFIAALLSAVMFSCLYAVGSSHNISIENGFVTFAKDAVKIVFMGEEEEKRIDIKTLLEDLAAHGFENILLPQKLYEYNSSVPVYSNDISKVNNRVEFNIGDDIVSYSLRIENTNYEGVIVDYFTALDNAKTFIIDDVCVYVFEYENDLSAICFVSNGYDYFIQANISLSEMINTAKTITKTEE